MSGFSIDLWRALASQVGIGNHVQIVTTVQEQLDAVEPNQADIAIAAISTTAEREKGIDFSHRYFESGLGILTRSGSSTPLLDSFPLAFSPTLLRLFAFLVLSILIAGLFIIANFTTGVTSQLTLQGLLSGPEIFLASRSLPLPAAHPTSGL